MKPLTFEQLKRVQNIPNYYKFYLSDLCSQRKKSCKRKPTLYYFLGYVPSLVLVYSFCPGCRKRLAPKNEEGVDSLIEFTAKEIFTIGIL